MSRALRVLVRIVGSAVGLLAGGVLLAWLLPGVFGVENPGNCDDLGRFGNMVLAGLGLLVGGTTGAAAGATITQKVMRQRSSFWKALLGTLAGEGLAMLIGIMLAALGLPEVPDWLLPWAFFVAIALVCAAVVVGAVIGSGCKAKPAAEAQG